MTTSPNGIEMIKKFEAPKGNPCLTPNQCVGDILTIGWGHTKGEISSKTVITVEQAEEFLRQDLDVAEKVVNSKVTVPLNQNQFDALVSFVFNIGKLGPTMLKKLNSLDYVGAAREFQRWTFFHGYALPGLEARRQKEMEVFLS